MPPTTRGSWNAPRYPRMRRCRFDATLGPYRVITKAATNYGKFDKVSAIRVKAAEDSGLRSLEIEELGRLLEERRQENNLSIRQAAREAEVSFSTFSRVEAGAQPDLATFLRLCAWLRVPPATFFPTVPSRRPDVLQNLADALYSDPRLDPQAAELIAQTVSRMYESLAKEPDSPKTVVCHLRAASTLRPGAVGRLASILVELRDGLECLDKAGQL